MEIFLMKLLISVVVSFLILNAECREWYIRNESSDSFSVNVYVNDPRVVIAPLITATDPPKILGTVEQPHGGKGSFRREKRYNVTFKEGYVPSPGEEPFVSFRNDNTEFKLVFFSENYAELHSVMALKRYDDPIRKDNDRLYNQHYFGEKTIDIGNVKHWVLLDRHLVVCCYERYRFAVRCIDICDTIGSVSWIQEVKEDEFDLRLGIDLPPQLPRQPRQHWWSRLCCCDSCCTD
jgi:hypothetical protein